MTDIKPAEPVNLTERRLRMGLSRSAAARAIGVSYDVLETAEEGGRPRPPHALAIADFYGLDVIAQWPLDREAA